MGLHPLARPLLYSSADMINCALEERALGVAQENARLRPLMQRALEDLERWERGLGPRMRGKGAVAGLRAELGKER